MAFGRHWEWRGFGAIGANLRRALEALPLKFPDAQDITDEYLWSPRCRTNVKLRLGDLKLKRLVRAERDLELWLEDPGENYAFPVGEAPLRLLFEALGVDRPALPAQPIERAEMLDLLRTRAPEVRVVSVSKSRRQYVFTAAGARAGGPEREVTVELAEIHTPERTVSVGLEGQEREAVARTRDAFDLERHLRRMSYFEALGIWAAGGRVGGNDE